MMSRINYDLTKIRAIAFDVDGVLSPLTIPVTPDGKPMRMTNMRDGLAIKRASDIGIPLIVISGARASGIETRLEAVGFKEIHMGVKDKVSLLLDWMNRHNLDPAQVAYAGDDLPDVAPMGVCGLRVAPADAVPEIKNIANYISPLDGGYGVARDLIEQILRAQNKWTDQGTIAL